MKKLILAVSLLASIPASAATWATGDCVTQYGLKIIYAVHEGNGFIAYGNGEPSPMFTERKGELGIINHIGPYGQMRMAVNFNTGKGYIVTQRDSGEKIEGWISCKLSVINR